MLRNLNEVTKYLIDESLVNETSPINLKFCKKVLATFCDVLVTIDEFLANKWIF